MIEFVDALLLLFLFFPPSNWGYYIFACVCNRTKLKRFLFQVHRQVMEIYNGYNCIVLSSENLMKIQLDLWIDGNMGVSLLNRSGWERKQSFLWLDRWCLDSWGWTSSSSLSPWTKIQKSTPPKKKFLHLAIISAALGDSLRVWSGSMYEWMEKTMQLETGSLKMVWYSVLRASSSAGRSRWFAENRGAICQMVD